MEIETFDRIISERKEIRDNLYRVKEELENLSKNDVVKRYIELKEYYSKYEFLYSLSDERIFNELLYTSSIDNLKVYFCFGKDYIARCTKIGKYYIPNSPNCGYGVPAAVYKNLFNMYDEVIIPLEDCESFEKDNEVVFSKTNNPTNEYLDLRKDYYKNEMKKILK